MPGDKTFDQARDGANQQRRSSSVGEYSFSCGGGFAVESSQFAKELDELFQLVVGFVSFVRVQMSHNVGFVGIYEGVAA